MHTSTVVGIAVAAAATGLAINALIKSTGTNRKNGFPNAPWNWPLIGQTLMFLKGPGSLNSVLTARGSTDAINISSFGMDQLVMLSPDAVKWAGMKGPGSAVSGVLMPRWYRLLGANSITLTEDPHVHKRLRHILGLSITKDVLERCYPQLSSNAESLMAEFATETQRTNKPIGTHHNIKLFTFNAILFFIFGSRTQDVQILQANFDNFVIWMAGLGDIFIPEFMNGPFAKAMVARTKLTSILLAIIKERREGVAADSDDQESDGLNKILFGNHEGIFLSDNELVDNLLVMIFVGHDTSTGSISSSIHYWANEMAPEEKEMLLREIEDVDGTNMTELLALPVLDAFMKEVLRMAAPATAILRKLNQDADILGHVVPSGSVLMLPYGALSYNPDVFPEPNKFNIARFLDLSAQDAKKQAYAYSPFGLGARQCLGMHLARLELKIFMFQLLKSFVVLKSDIPSVIEGFPVMMVKPQVKVLSVLEKHYA